MSKVQSMSKESVQTWNVLILALFNTLMGDTKRHILLYFFNSYLILFEFIQKHKQNYYNEKSYERKIVYTS